MASPSPRFQTTIITLIKQRLSLCYHALSAYGSRGGGGAVIQTLRIGEWGRLAPRAPPLDPLLFSSIRNLWSGEKLLQFQNDFEHALNS